MTYGDRFAAGICCWQWYWVDRHSHGPLRCQQNGGEQESHPLLKASISAAVALAGKSLSVALTAVPERVFLQQLFLRQQIGRTAGCHASHLKTHLRVSTGDGGCIAGGSAEADGTC